jgi:hypothetical protein
VVVFPGDEESKDGNQAGEEDKGTENHNYFFRRNPIA